ncbi:MAG: PD-(D/E)XK nuclease family protein [Thermaurantimonas sp.]
MTFLREKVAELFGRHADELHQIAVVLPSQRSVLFFLTYLAEYSPKTAIAPDVMTMDQFISRITGSEVTDYSKLLIALLKVARDRVPDRCATLSEFMSWGPLLLKDFSAIDDHLIDPGLILTNTARAKLLEQWQPNTDSRKGPLEEKFEKFYDSLHDLYWDFRTYLDQNAMHTRGSIRREASQKIRTDQKLPGSKVYFLGFNALTGSELDIVNHLVKSGKAEYEGDFDSYYCTRFPSHEAGTFFRKLSKYGILSENFSMTDSLSTDQKSIVHHCVSGRIEQTNVLAGLIRTMQEHGRTDFTRVAVVLPDESMLFPLMNHLPKVNGGINVTIQLPLDSLPYFQWILSYINAVEFAGRDREKDGFFYRHLTELLGNSISYRFFDFKKVNELLLHIRREKILFLSAEEIRDRLGINDTKLFSVCDTSEELIRSAGILVGLGIDRSTSLPLFESEQLHMLREVLNELSESVAQWPENFFSIKEIPMFLKGMATSYGLSLKGEPVEGLQVMGMLETRLLSFDAVFILSSNDEILSKNHVAQSIIPYDVALAHGLPEHRQQQAILSYHFYQLLRNSREVHLISYEPVLGSDHSIPSRFVYQCKWELSRHNPNITFSEVRYTQPITVSRHPGKFTLKKDAAFQADLRSKLIERGISPTDLVNYIERPKNFYTRYLLEIKETTEVTEELDSRISGTIIHDTLKDLYEPFLNREFPKERELLELINKSETVLMYHLQKAFPQIDWSKGKNYLSKRIAHQMVINQINIDLKRLREDEKFLDGRSIRFLEHLVETHITGPLDTPVRLFGFIDRVEEKNGVMDIIDYKTGKIFENQPAHYDLSNIDFSDKEKRVRAGKPLQLICYMIMLANHMGTSGTYRYNASLHFIRYGGENRKYLFKEKNSNKFDLNNTDLYYFNSEDIEQCKEIVVAILNEILDIDGVENQYLQEL